MSYAEKRKKDREVKLGLLKKQRLIRTTIAVFVGVLLIFGIWKLSTLPVFSLKSVEFAGYKNIKIDVLESLIKEHYGTNLFRISSDTIKSQLKKNPWIKGIEIKKQFPDKMLITLEEEVPQYALNSSGRIWLLSGNFKLLEETKKGTKSNLPVIQKKLEQKIIAGQAMKDILLINAFKIIKSLDLRIRRRIEKVNAESVDNFFFTLDKGKIQIIYGRATNINKKNFILKSILDDSLKRKLNIYYIDIRSIKAPVVKRIPSSEEIQKNI